MSDSLLGGMIPARYILPEKADKYDEVIVVGWLNVEVDKAASQKSMALLDLLRGYRNREVYGFVKKTNDNWFNRLAVEMYGATNARIPKEGVAP
jgi:hypothetical protein